MLREIDQNIWVAEQPFRYFGLSVGTRMTVIRLENHDLVVISPIQANNGLVEQLGEIGTVKHIISPNLYHYLFAADFKAFYPSATFWATPGLKDKKPDLLIDQIIESNGNNLWNGIDYVFFDGFKTVGFSGFDSLNECVFFHAASRTLILTDTAFHFDESFPVMTQLATRVLGGFKNLSPSLLERIATTEKGKVKESVKRILEWEFERVIMAHGNVIERNGKEKFKQGYERFLRQSIYVTV
jgi:hypothetical protein